MSSIYIFFPFLFGAHIVLRYLKIVCSQVCFSARGYLHSQLQTLLRLANLPQCVNSSPQYVNSSP